MSIAELPELPEGYDILKDTGEYMNPFQLTYFKKVLENEKNILVDSMKPKVENIAQFDSGTGDEGDMASAEMNRSITLRITDRQSKLINKINQALLRIDKGEYGYCEVTGEEIGLKRLIARPMTNMTVAEQEKRESKELIHEKYEDSEYLLVEDAPDSGEDE